MQIRCSNQSGCWDIDADEQMAHLICIGCVKNKIIYRIYPGMTRLLPPPGCSILTPHINHDLEVTFAAWHCQETQTSERKWRRKPVRSLALAHLPVGKPAHPHRNVVHPQAPALFSQQEGEGLLRVQINPSRATSPGKVRMDWGGVQDIAMRSQNTVYGASASAPLI